MVSDSRQHNDNVPVYSIQHDPPWVQKPVRGSLAPSASVYSEDDFESRVLEQNMPEVPPLRLHKSNHPSYHAHPNQTVRDNGPQIRQSRLPIFKQVRSMLHKPPPPLNTRDISYPQPPREVILNERHAQVAKRSSRGSSLKEEFEVRRCSPERRSAKGSKDISPLSVLEDDEWEQTVPPGNEWEEEARGPSPVSAASASPWTQDERHVGPSQVSANAVSNPMTPSPSTKVIKRKPAPRSLSLASENIPPQQSPPPTNSPPPSRGTTVGSVAEIPPKGKSHFSWTTYGAGTPVRPSFDTTGRPSIDRPSMDMPRHVRHESREAEQAGVSRFSWSTVNTNQVRADSPPPSPPPPVPSKYRQPPVQSILSRHRPVQRIENHDWAHPRKPSPTSYHTPTSVKSKLSVATNYPGQQSGSNPGSANKQLPLPPDIMSPVTPLTHLETLLREEQDKMLQRRNMEHVIAELAKIENASPMDVPFAQVRDAKKKLEEHRKTLEEIKLEEREIGIAIARARRKEGEEEGLWVRRVTG